MKRHGKPDENIIVTLSLNELIAINNALNEVCNAFGIDEFQTRMGATVEEARELLREVHEVIEGSGGSQSPSTEL